MTNAGKRKRGNRKPGGQRVRKTPLSPPETSVSHGVMHLRLDPSDPDAPELTIEPNRLKRAVSLAERKDAIEPFPDAWTYKVRSQRGGAPRDPTPTLDTLEMSR